MTLNRREGLLKLLAWAFVFQNKTGVAAGDPLQSKKSSLKSSTDPVSVITFGSCAKQDRPHTLWPEISKVRPDLFLMIGDNIYADTSDPKVFDEKYQQLAAIPSFKSFRENHRILATWDDHDYGLNDGGEEFAAKEIAKKAFVDFWDIPATSPIHSQPGIYQSEIFGPLGRQVQIILLDTRFFRGPLKKGVRGYVPNPDPTSSMLGDTQWAWLESELKKPADLRVLVSSIQVIAEEHPYEKWANLPLQRQKLLDLIAKTNASGVVMISGDRHHGEISKLPKQISGSYDLYDLTSSGMTEKGRGFRDEKNQWRVSSPQAFMGNQFGEISINWDAKPSPTVELILRDEKRESIAAVKFKLSELGSRHP